MGRITSLADITLRAGDRLCGYVVKRVVTIPRLQLTSVELCHEKTKAQHLHIARLDDNNTFTVSFRTPPPDSSGVCHVLEHVVLCGSKKYPCRDPFFKMLNRSLATYMNAWTWSDCTMYPFSTCNEIDFHNLLSVYLDASFFPNIEEFDFYQEGWRLEPSNLENAKATINETTIKKIEPSDFEIKGVVYNEMKGSLSDKERVFGEYFNSHLFEKGTYHHNSGGNPPEIVSGLCWEKLRNFHKTYYHPSNARFVTYGDMDLKLILEAIDKNALSKFEYIEPRSDLQLGAVYTKPKSVQIDGPVTSPWMAVGWNLGNDIFYIAENSASCQKFENDKDSRLIYSSFIMRLIASLLHDGASTPLYKALIKPGIASDFSPNTGYEGQMAQHTLTFGLQDITKSSNEILSIIENTLYLTVCKNGFDCEQVDGVLHQIELSLNNQTAEHGLELMQQIIFPWSHGISPEAILKVSDLIEFARIDLKSSKFISTMLEKCLFNNNNRLLYVMNPKEDFFDEISNKEKEMIKKMAESLSNDQIIELTKRGLALQEIQQKPPNTAVLPMLAVSEIDKFNRPEEVVRLFCDNPYVNFAQSTQPTNGITNLRILFALDNIDNVSLLPYVPIYCHMITRMATKKYDTESLNVAIKGCTAGIDVSPNIGYHPVKPLDDCHLDIYWSVKYLNSKTDEAIDLIMEILSTADFTNVERFKTLFTSFVLECQNSVVDMGHMMAMQRAASSISSFHALRECMNGTFLISFVTDILKKSGLMVSPTINSEFVASSNDVSSSPTTTTTLELSKEGRQELEKVIKACQLLHNYVMTKCPVSIQINSDSQGVQKSTSKVSSMINQLNFFSLGDKKTLPAIDFFKYDEEPRRNSPISKFTLAHFFPNEDGSSKDVIVSNNNSKCFIPLPMTVNFCSLAVPIGDLSNSQNQTARIMARLATACFLHREIREIGGAYGSGASVIGGVLCFYSYRDPNNNITFQNFSRSGKWLCEPESVTDQLVDEAKLATFQRIDSPLAPTDRSLTAYFKRMSAPLHQKLRDYSLGVDKESLLAVANLLKDRIHYSSTLSNNNNSSSMAILGPENIAEQFKAENWFVHKIM